MIDTVTLDLWNTLISNTPQDAQRFRTLRINGIVEAFLSRGIRISHEKVGQALDLCFKKCWDLWAENIDFSPQEQIEILMSFLPDFGQKLSPDLLKQIERAYTESLLESPSDLVEGSSEILNYLKNQKYKLGLICNTGRSPGKVLRKLMERYQILEYFDVLSFSDELRIRKPHPEIFIFTLEKLKSTPSSSIHIGDELHTDVKGAKGVGMTAIHFSKGSSEDQEIQPDHSIRELKEIRRIVEGLRRA